MPRVFRYLGGVLRAWEGAVGGVVMKDLAWQ